MPGSHALRVTGGIQEEGITTQQKCVLRPLGRAIVCALTTGIVRTAVQQEEAWPVGQTQSERAELEATVFRSVILASAVGTMIEWYDFYIFGSLAAVLSPKFYPPGNDTFALHRLSLDLRRRLPRSSLRRALLRTHRRPRRPQVRLPRHAHHHGRRHSPHRPAAHVRNRRVVRADHSSR